MQTLTLYHYTHQKYAEPIRREGLRVKKARTLPRVWLANSRKRGWAQQHVAESHKWPETALTCVTVEVPRVWLARWRRGVWLCNRDIPADRIVSIE